MRKQLGRKGRTLVVAIGVAAVLVGTAMPAAWAATPSVQGCVGTSISAAATAFGEGFGSFLSEVARDTSDRPGLGDAVQALESGQVSDTGFTNTCNN
jgi:hypothetical protein